VITNDKVRWFFVSCAFIGGPAQLKKYTSSKYVWPIVADHAQEEYGGSDIAVMHGLRLEKVMH
jgi:hypothetical protein